MIGRHEPSQPDHVDLKSALAEMLNEALTALEEAIYDLSDDKVWRRTFADKHAIGTMVMHLIETLDTYTCKFQTGQFVLDHQGRFDIWKIEDGSMPEEGEDLPTVKQMVSSIRKLRQAALAALRSATESDLLGVRQCDHWWTKRGRTAGDAYMRAIGHAMAHIRQIWLMRGAMGLSSKDGWPNQHLA